jgi:hypothetical protein
MLKTNNSQIGANMRKENCPYDTANIKKLVNCPTDDSNRGRKNKCFQVPRLGTTFYLEVLLSI